MLEEMGETGFPLFHFVSGTDRHNDLQRHDILRVGRYDDHLHPVIENARLSAGRQQGIRSGEGSQLEQKNYENQ